MKGPKRTSIGEGIVLAAGRLTAVLSFPNLAVQAGACIAILRTARELQMVDQLEELAGAEGLTPAAVEAMMTRAITHRADAVRSNALHLVCSHRRTTALPTALELRLAGVAVTHGLRCTSAVFRSKLVARVATLLVRARGSVAAYHNRRGDWGAPGAAEGVAALQAWLQWLAGALVGSAYPGSPFERKFMAVELLGKALEVFGDQLQGQEVSAPRVCPPESGDTGHRGLSLGGRRGCMLS